MGEERNQLAKEKQTLSQGNELSQILHVGRKRLRISINYSRKGETFIYFSTSIYSAPKYQALRLEVPNKTDKNPRSHRTYLHSSGYGIKYSAYYMVPNAQKEYSEQ